MTDPRHANPDPEKLADEDDELDWDVNRDGRMAEHATDDEPETKPYEGGDEMNESSGHGAA